MNIIFIKFVNEFLNPCNAGLVDFILIYLYYSRGFWKLISQSKQIECDYMNIKIEEYQALYHKQVIDLVTSIQQQEFNLPITYADQPDLAEILKFFDIFLVAVIEDKIVGTIGLKQFKDFAILRKMFVKKDFRGGNLGVAQKLLAYMEEKAILCNISQIYLGTTEIFKAAHRFYKRNNYIETLKSGLPEDFPVMKIDTKFYYKGL